MSRNLAEQILRQKSVLFLFDADGCLIVPEMGTESAPVSAPSLSRPKGPHRAPVVPDSSSRVRVFTVSVGYFGECEMKIASFLAFGGPIGHPDHPETPNICSQSCFICRVMS